MGDRKDFKVGNKVKHRFRNNKYQKCTVIEIEEGCNGGIIIFCEDGYYGKPENVTFPPQDLEIIKK